VGEILCAVQTETLLEQLFFTTVYIETRLPGGGVSKGTGFLYDVQVAGNDHVVFLVTNKHVIKDAEHASIRFVAGLDGQFSGPKLGEFHTIETDNPGAAFIGHPDDDIDVCAVAIGPSISSLHSRGSFVFYRALTAAQALNEQNALTLDAIEAITFVGYPIGLYDEKNFLPIARRGHTATPPVVDYGGKPMFLVDASVFPGSSGSPVLIAENGTYNQRGGAVFGQRIMLLGILAAVFDRAVPVLQIPARMQAIVRDSVNIGIVYKAKVIDETIDLILATHKLTRLAGPPVEVIAEPSRAGDALSEPPATREDS
jgi:hypothetical protein